MYIIMTPTNKINFSFVVHRHYDYWLQLYKSFADLYELHKYTWCKILMGWSLHYFTMAVVIEWSIVIPVNYVVFNERNAIILIRHMLVASETTSHVKQKN